MQCMYVQTDLHDLSCQEGYECMHSISQLSHDLIYRAALFRRTQNRRPAVTAANDNKQVW
jgi:hypothetical protein